ncbi:MAG: thioredoxin-dependent thiol peroxidase [Candidatus Kapabacteria bacterium]|nr:thioredoxin-dependent thiol peroxidase [Candidatus Kapabacteria bacterium]
MKLAIGDKAPAFTTTDENGNSVSLKEFKGKTVVLYFYPKDNTSGCTAQACDFRDNMERITASGAVVLGVSPDSEKSHTKFIADFDLNFRLLADTSKEICEGYGVWVEKSMYGRKYMGVARTTFIINGKGKITHIFENVKVPGHADAVMEALGA